MDGSRRRAFVAVGGTVALAIALAACGGTSNNAGSGSSPAAMQPVDLKLMVGGLNKQIYLPNMLAKQLGYFDAEKINITLVDEGSGQGTELEVVAGNVDAGSGAYSHPVELNALGKKIETICQFGIAPGEAEMVATKKADSIKSPSDLKGKNLGVTDIGSGTHTITLALLGKAGYKGSDAHFVAVGAGNTFIAAIKNGTIDAGMTTEPTITRLLQSGDAKVLVDLMTPTSTKAAEVATPARTTAYATRTACSEPGGNLVKLDDNLLKVTQKGYKLFLPLVPNRGAVVSQALRFLFRATLVGASRDW